MGNTKQKSGLFEKNKCIDKLASNMASYFRVI